MYLPDFKLSRGKEKADVTSLETLLFCFSKAAACQEPWQILGIVSSVFDNLNLNYQKTTGNTRGEFRQEVRTGDMVLKSSTGKTWLKTREQ